MKKNLILCNITYIMEYFHELAVIPPAERFSSNSHLQSKKCFNIQHAYFQSRYFKSIPKGKRKAVWSNADNLFFLIHSRLTWSIYTYNFTFVHIKFFCIWNWFDSCHDGVLEFIWEQAFSVHRQCLLQW